MAAEHKVNGDLPLERYSASPYFSGMELDARLKKARKAADLTQAQAGEAAGVDQSTYAHWERGRSVPSFDTLQKLADTFKVNRYWLITGEEAPQENSSPGKDTDDFVSNVRSAPDAPEVTPFIYQRDVRILGTTRCGDDGAFEMNQGEVIGWAPRPPGLIGVKDVYSLYCEGDSMYPRFRGGQLIYVHARKPIAPECDVVIQFKPKHEGDNPPSLLKTLVSKGAGGLKVKQWNPEKEITISENKILAVHRVLTLEELLNA